MKERVGLRLYFLLITKLMQNNAIIYNSSVDIFQQSQNSDQELGEEVMKELAIMKVLETTGPI